MKGLIGLSLTTNQVTNIEYLAIGLLVLFAFVIAARFVPRFADAQLRRRHLPPSTVVASKRVVAVLVLAVGIFAALGFAIQNANVTLAGIVLATIVAALGLQNLLQDYVSGYYVLLERHVRLGDRISLDGIDAGKVIDIRLRVTLLQTDSGDLIVVPNSELFTKAVTVYARATERAAETKSEPPA